MEQLRIGFGTPVHTYTRAALALLTPDDIFAVADEELLFTLKEDRRIERKLATIHGGDLGEYFSMWANTPADGGLMVLGQANDGAFSGCLGLNQNQINDLEKAGLYHCPEAYVESRRVAVTRVDGEQDFVVLIRVHYNPRKVVRDVRSKAFGRIGDSKILLSPDQIRELEIAKGEVDLEQEPVNLMFPEDFDAPLIRQYVEAVIRIKNLTLPHSDIEILSQARLGRLKGQVFFPNNACALLFAKDPLLVFPGCKVRFLRFDGDTELTGKSYNAVKDFFIEGSIPHVIVETAKHLKAQLREFSTLAADGRFYSETEYPEDAWYEAVVNACVHRSYALKNMVVFVKMFDDRLVVESPGGFPPNVTPDTIYYTHSPRNPHLMNALYHLAFVKAANEGTRRIRDLMQASNLPKPEFAQKEQQSGYNAVRVTLRNDIRRRKQWIDSAAGRLLEPAAWKDLPPAELRILNYVAEHGSINVTQSQKLVAASGMRWQRVKKLLTAMVERGLLVHQHSATIERDRTACYRLPKRDR